MELDEFFKDLKEKLVKSKNKLTSILYVVEKVNANIQDEENKIKYAIQSSEMARKHAHIASMRASYALEQVYYAQKEYTEEGVLNTTNRTKIIEFYGDFLPPKDKQQGKNSIAGFKGCIERLKKNKGFCEDRTKIIELISEVISCIEKIEKHGESMRQSESNAQKLIKETKNSIRLNELPIGFSLIFKIGLCIGVLVAFTYCFMIIKYFPSGLSLEDSIGFLFLALAYGLFVFVLEGFILGLMFWVDGLSFKKRFVSREARWVKQVVLFFLLIYFFGVADVNTIKICLAFYGFNFILFLATSDLVNSVELTKEKRKKIICLLIPCLFLFIFVDVFGLSIIKSIMKQLKFSESNATLLLSNSDYKTIQNIAKERNLPVLYGCEEGNTEVRNINILWNNLGENIYIELPQNANGETVRTELKRADTKVISKIPNNNNIEGCVIAHIPNVFASGSAVLTEEAKKDIKTKIPNWIENLQEGYTVGNMIIKGYSDFTPYKKGGSNTTLSQQRAEAVKEDLTASYQNSEKWQIKSKGEGNKNTNDECEKKFTSQADIDFCQGMNRGVTLQFHIKYQSK